MPYFNQEQPGPYPFLEETAQKVPPPANYVLAAVFAVGFYFYGLHYPRIPLAVWVGVGLITGLLAVTLLKHLAAFLITAALVVIATLGAWFLFRNDATLRNAHADPAAQAAPARSAKVSPGGLLNDLRKAVE